MTQEEMRQARYRRRQGRLAAALEFSHKVMVMLDRLRQVEQLAGVCPFCSEEVEDLRDSYQLSYGWVRKRRAGGANAVALKRTIDVWAHTRCVEGRRERWGTMR